jgi:fermentation-respiration switch protein FrsA (DUF1100 family)
VLLGGCTSTFFQPDRRLVATPAALGVDYQSMTLHAADGTELFAWFLPARGRVLANVLFLHGNAENISTHFANVAWLPADGFNVLALDYRGYGGSAGAPTLAGVQLDIEAGMRGLLARPEAHGAPVVVLGQSLGAALAIYYVAHSAERARICTLVADSAFADFRRIASEKLAAFPLTWPLQWLPALTVDNDYSPERSVRDVAPIALLLLHGEADEVVPPEHSRRLFALAQQPKTLWLFPGVGHIGAMRDPAVRTRLSRFLTEKCAH